MKEFQDSLRTRYHCRLTVPSPSPHSQYTVSVKPRKQGKYIKSFRHSEFALLCIGPGTTGVHCVTPVNTGISWASLCLVTFKVLQTCDSQ